MTISLQRKKMEYQITLLPILPSTTLFSVKRVLLTQWEINFVNFSFYILLDIAIFFYMVIEMYVKYIKFNTLNYAVVLQCFEL